MNFPDENEERAQRMVDAVENGEELDERPLRERPPSQVRSLRAPRAVYPRPFPKRRAS